MPPPAGAGPHHRRGRSRRGRAGRSPRRGRRGSGNRRSARRSALRSGRPQNGSGRAAGGPHRPRRTNSAALAAPSATGAHRREGGVRRPERSGRRAGGRGSPVRPPARRPPRPGDGVPVPAAGTSRPSARLRCPDRTARAEQPCGHADPGNFGPPDRRRCCRTPAPDDRACSTAAMSHRRIAGGGRSVRTGIGTEHAVVQDARPGAWWDAGLGELEPASAALSVPGLPPGGRRGKGRSSGPQRAVRDPGASGPAARDRSPRFRRALGEPGLGPLLRCGQPRVVERSAEALARPGAGDVGEQRTRRGARARSCSGTRCAEAPVAAASRTRRTNSRASTTWASESAPHPS